MREEQRLVGHLLDHARFRRRHLADDRGEHGRALVRDRGHLHRHVERFERDIAVALAERRFRFEHVRIDHALDDDLGIGRHVEIDADRARHADRLARDAARNGRLIGIHRELQRAGEAHDRRRPEHDRDRHRLLSLVVFEPMQIAARAARPRHHAHREPVVRLQRRAIGAHVLHAAVGIARDAERRREIRRGIEPRRRHRHGKVRESEALQIVALDHDLLAARRIDDDGRDRIGDGAVPGLADLLQRHAHADRVNARRGGERAHHHRHVVAPALRVDDVGEHERLAVVLGDAAQELPAHERMQLGVLVDRAVHMDQQSLPLQLLQMVLEVQRRSRPLRGRAAIVVRTIGHSRMSCQSPVLGGQCNSSAPFAKVSPSLYCIAPTQRAHA